MQAPAGASALAAFSAAVPVSGIATQTVESGQGAAVPSLPFDPQARNLVVAPVLSPVVAQAPVAPSAHAASPHTTLMASTGLVMQKLSVPHAVEPAGQLPSAPQVWNELASLEQRCWPGVH